MANHLERVVYGVVIKHATSCEYSGNLVISPTINGILFKYATDCVAYYNTVIADVARTSGVVRIGADGANNSSGCLVKYNNIIMTDTTNAYFTTVDASNTGTFDGNNWDGSSVSGAKWDYQGTDYTTLATWNALASTGTDTAVASGLDARYLPSESSGLRAAGAWLTGVLAYDDLPIPLHPDIGAVQDRNAAGRRFGVGSGTL
jgi:hypothetical protein